MAHEHKAMWKGRSLAGLQCLTKDYTVTRRDVEVEIPSDEEDRSPRENAFASAMLRKLNAVCRAKHVILTMSEAKLAKDSHITMVEWWREDGDPRSEMRMFCGVQATIFDDGTATPSGVEFFDPEAAENATCVECKLKWDDDGRPMQTRQQSGWGREAGEIESAGDSISSSPDSSTESS